MLCTQILGVINFQSLGGSASRNAKDSMQLTYASLKLLKSDMQAFQSDFHANERGDHE